MDTMNVSKKIQVGKGIRPDEVTSQEKIFCLPMRRDRRMSQKEEKWSESEIKSFCETASKGAKTSFFSGRSLKIN